MAKEQTRLSILLEPSTAGHFTYFCGNSSGLDKLMKDALVSKWIASSHSSSSERSANKTARDSISSGLPKERQSKPTPPSCSIPAKPSAKSARSSRESSGHKSCLVCHPVAMRTSDMTGLDPTSCFARRMEYSRKPVASRDALSPGWRAYFDRQSQLFTWRKVRMKKKVDSFKLNDCPISDRYKQFLCNDACFYYCNEWRLGNTHQPLVKIRR